MDEEDWEGWQKLTAELGDKVQLVGDDLFRYQYRASVLNQPWLRKFHLIKLNQIGSVSETLEAPRWQATKPDTIAPFLLHRSGETEDTTIADLAVALNTCQIKTGAPSRNRACGKIQPVTRIEEELGAAAVYPCMGAFNVQK